MRGAARGGEALARLWRRWCWAIVGSAHDRPHSRRPPIYKDPRQPVDRRVDDLLSRMTLDEKVAQLKRSGSRRPSSRRPTATSRPSSRRRTFRTASAASPAHPTTAVSPNRTAPPARRARAVNRDARQTAEYRQRRAALGGRAYAARHPDPDARGVAARLCRARRDQLPAGDRACEHLGSRSRQPRLLRRRARGARARRDPRRSRRSSTSRAIRAGAGSRRRTARIPIS